MTYKWCLHPDYASGEWHLVSGKKVPIWGSSVVAVCGRSFPRRAYVEADQSGWIWIRERQNMVCLPCLDVMVLSAALTAEARRITRREQERFFKTLSAGS